MGPAVERPAVEPGLGRPAQTVTPIIGLSLAGAPGGAGDGSVGRIAAGRQARLRLTRLT